MRLIGLSESKDAKLRSGSTSPPADWGLASIPSQIQWCIPMSDERLCAHCGKKPIPTKNTRYCSNACREAAETARAAAGALRHPSGYLSSCQSAATPTAFSGLQGDAVLSDWKPSLNAKPEDMPDIPDFLRISQERRKQAWMEYDHKKRDA